MAENRMILTKESWGHLSSENQSWIIYNTVNDLDSRVQRIEHRCTHCYNGRLFSKTISFLGGCLGGIIGFFSSKFFNG